MHTEFHNLSTGAQRSHHTIVKPWGNWQGKPVFLFTLQNSNGGIVELINYGASIVSIVVPDKHEKFENVVLGYPSLEGYLNDHCYIGSTVGRFANRIANGSFELDGRTYQLAQNDGRHTNHGGPTGMHAKVFDYTVEEAAIIFTCESPDREGGFPGTLKLQVKYSWSDDFKLSIQYTAASTKNTVLNITNHAYFNLRPNRSDILSHRISISSNRFLETTADYIPTGAINTQQENVFRGKEIREHVQYKNGLISGINSFYIFNRSTDQSSPICSLTEDSSGRVLELFTDYPGVQFYTGDFLTGKTLNHQSSYYKPFDGLCLECQHYPDSPNHKHFPSTELKVDETYHQHIVYKFSTKQ